MITPAHWCWLRTTAICSGWRAMRSGAWPTVASRRSTAISTTTRAGCVREAAVERERTRDLRKRLEKIEARTAAIDGELAALQERLADPAIYTGPTAVLAGIGRAQNTLREEKSALESEWLARYAELEGTAA